MWETDEAYEQELQRDTAIEAAWERNRAILAKVFLAALMVADYCLIYLA